MFTVSIGNGSVGGIAIFDLRIPTISFRLLNQLGIAAQFPSNADEDEEENIQLSALPIGRANIRLIQRIHQC